MVRQTEDHCVCLALSVAESAKISLPPFWRALKRPQQEASRKKNNLENLFVISANLEL